MILYNHKEQFINDLNLAFGISDKIGYEIFVHGKTKSSTLLSYSGFKILEGYIQYYESKNSSVIPTMWTFDIGEEIVSPKNMLIIKQKTSFPWFINHKVFFTMDPEIAVQCKLMGFDNFVRAYH